MLMAVLRRSFQEVVVPELKQIRAESAEIRTTLQITNKRLDDMNAHLVEQIRRIDDIHHRIDQTNQRIDETNQRIDETNQRIDAVHTDVIARIDATNRRLDETNDRLNRLYEVVVRREEHEGLSQRVGRLEQQVAGLLERVAA